MFFSFLHHSGYGQDGPYANRGGYDVVAAALSGLIHITGPQVGSFTQATVKMGLIPIEVDMM